MTDNISVPRDLLIDVRDSTNEAGNLSYRQHHIDHHRRLTRKLDELLEAPAAEVEGLEVIGFHCMDSAGIETLELRGGSYADEPLCSLPKAQAIIDQQAALLKEALKALDNVGLIDSYIDFDSVHATKERLKATTESMYTLDELTDHQAARIAELQKDADRYRWLEANSTYGIDYRQRPELTLPIYAPDHRDGLDAAIDAAMEGSKGE